MQETSALYKQIITSPNHWFETSLVVGDKGYLIEETEGAWIIFGTVSGEETSEPVRIEVAGSSPINGFREDVIISLFTSDNLFANGVPEVGCCVSNQIDVSMIEPIAQLRRKAKLRPYVRAKGYINGELQTSEWIQKGEFYIDTRTVTQNDDGLNIMTVHGYDAMLLAEADYPSDNEHNYPLRDTEMVQFIADHMNMENDDGTISSVEVDQRTFDIMTAGYEFTLPIGYSMREVLSKIAASYCGNFIITDTGKLRLVLLNELPIEQSYLIDQAGYTIVFGYLPLSSYEIVPIEGAEYGFEENEDEYYESTNQGISDSYSLCRVVITTHGNTTVRFDCINYAENNNDFGIIGRQNVPLDKSIIEDLNVLKSYKGLSSPSVQSVSQRIENAGTYFYDVKYRKNATINQYNDSFQFKVTLTDEEVGEEVRILV